MMDYANKRPPTPNWFGEPLALLRAFIDLFMYESPYQNVDRKDPFFSFSLGDTHTPEAMRQANRKGLMLMLAVIPVAVLLAVLLAWGGSLFSVLVALTIFSVMAGFLVDFLCVLYGMNSVRALEPNLDVLRVSVKDFTALVKGRYQAALVRAWRGFYWLALTRAVLVAMWGVATVVYIQGNTSANMFAFERARYAGLYVGLYLAAAVYALTEPYWRYRAMTIIGVMTAAGFKSSYRSWTGAATAMFSFYFWQLIILVGWQFFAVVSQAFLGVEAAVRYVVPSTGSMTVLPFLFGLLAGIAPVLYLLVIRRSQLRFMSVQQLASAEYGFFHRRD